MSREFYWATDDLVTTPELIIDFHHMVEFNVIRLREAIQLGQRIERLAIDTWRNGRWIEIAQVTSVGSCRLVPLQSPVKTSRLRLRITSCQVCIALSELGVFFQSD
jgi:alpha-L-fucosidase